MLSSRLMIMKHATTLDYFLVKYIIYHYNLHSKQLLLFTDSVSDILHLWLGHRCKIFWRRPAKCVVLFVAGSVHAWPFSSMTEQASHLLSSTHRTPGSLHLLTNYLGINLVNCGRYLTGPLLTRYHFLSRQETKCVSVSPMAAQTCDVIKFNLIRIEITVPPSKERLSYLV